MDIIQTFRRLGQKFSGFSNLIDQQTHQLPLIKKLYTKNGFELKRTCEACPEQYEIFKNGKQVAYYRLRHGEFRVDTPDHFGETILEAEPIGDGIFNTDERLIYLTKALRALQETHP